MISLLLFLFVLPLIVLMIVNGIRGKGYKLALTLPPQGSKYRLPVRIGGLAYCMAGLVLVVLSQIDTYRDRGMSPRETLHSVIFFMSTIGLVGIVAYYRSKKSKS